MCACLHVCPILIILQQLMIQGMDNQECVPVFVQIRLWNNYIMQSKNSTSGVQLKPSHSSFSKNDHYDSTMQEEAIKFDETASESGSQKLYIAGLLEDEKKFDETASESGSQKLYVAGLLEDKKWHKEISFNWVKEFSYPQESLEAQLLAQILTYSAAIIMLAE